MPSRNNPRLSAFRLMVAAMLVGLGRHALAFQTAKILIRSPVVARRVPVVESSLPRTRNTLRLFSTAADLTEEQKVELEAKIKAKGDEIRVLKDDGADKAAVAPLVGELLALKAQLDPSILENKKKKQTPQKQQPKQQQQQKKGQQKKGGDDDSESDFITARAVDYSKWYNDIIRVAGLAEASPVRGCMVIKPWGMSLWDKIRSTLDVTIQDHGAENAYFPLLIPKSFLSKEAEHVDGFAKECAVVTHHRLKAGEGGLIADPEAELEDPLIIRPTSETMVWYMFRKWINSHRYVCIPAFCCVVC
jgi:prolyl-tRNA synthetase